MADVFDQATAREEKEREFLLAAQAAAREATPKTEPAGHCLNPRCGEPFEPGDPRLFCDRECADEHARLTR